MKFILIVVSIVGLLLALIPSFLVFFGEMSLEKNKTLMMIGTILWFVTAPFWMRSKTEAS